MCPVVQIPSNDADSNFPTFKWATHACSVAADRFLQSCAWWHEQVELCNYAHVPIGNLRADRNLFVMDLFFARSLRDNNHLLWVSDSAYPDLGGIEQDEDFFAVQDQHVELIKPNVFRNVCVEFEMQFLAINAILQADLVDELEGAKSVNACEDAFKVLRNCLKYWLKDAITNRNAFADDLCGNVYRWLKSTGALLFDPALQRLVYTLMQKVLLQLLAKLRNFNASVVYAGFSRIIVSTNRTQVNQAVAAVGFITKSIAAQPIFKYLNLNIAFMWDVLVFMVRYDVSILYLIISLSICHCSHTHTTQTNNTV
jgi:DNA polymerase epsilon subunit 1